jgi:hypothetical protein
MIAVGFKQYLRDDIMVQVEFSVRIDVAMEVSRTCQCATLS